MRRVLNHVFVLSFYKANAGFFLFFFFVFFGAVEGNSLVAYHLSLMKSMLSSSTVLMLVFAFWTAYHIKCTAHFLKIINSETGSFLHNMQALSKQKQWFTYAVLYTSVYAPVLLYTMLVCFAGMKLGHIASALLALTFSLVSIGFFVSLIHLRMNNWLVQFRAPSVAWPFKKTFPFFLLFYFTTARKNVFLLAKAFSLSLLYVALVWNKGLYNNDSFLLFYLLLLLIHALFPYLAVRFVEDELHISRNLPLSLTRRGMAFILPYLLLLLPECFYLFCFGNVISIGNKLGYVLNLPASLFLLTAIQYSQAQQKGEYVKAVFALLFVSIFVIHMQAFWLWIAVQLSIAAILFNSGYYAYEQTKDETEG